MPHCQQEAVQRRLTSKQNSNNTAAKLLNRHFQNVYWKEYILLKCTPHILQHGHMPGPKRLHRFKKTEVILFFSSCNGMKVKTNSKKKTGKFTNMWKYF
jgi:hypothetical protein